MKNIVLVIDAPPDGDTSEKLRMGVGLTLEDGNKVSALFIDEGVFTGAGLPKEYAPVNYEIDKHLETFGALNVDLVAHESSAGSRHLTMNRFNIRMASDEEVSLLLNNADIVIT